MSDQLFLNCSTGNVSELENILLTKINLNIENEAGTTPLCIVSKCRRDLVAMLIEHGADVNFIGKDKISPLHWAVEYDNDEIIKILLCAGANVLSRDQLHETPLHWAAWTGHIKSAKLLVEHGADPTTKNIGGTTPIQLAKMQKHSELSAYFESLSNEN